MSSHGYSHNCNNNKDDDVADDEALARALQEEYESEYRQSLRRQHRPSATTRQSSSHRTGQSQSIPTAANTSRTQRPSSQQHHHHHPRSSSLQPRSSSSQQPRSSSSQQHPKQQERRSKNDDFIALPGTPPRARPPPVARTRSDPETNPPPPYNPSYPQRPPSQRPPPRILTTTTATARSRSMSPARYKNSQQPRPAEQQQQEQRRPYASSAMATLQHEAADAAMARRLERQWRHDENTNNTNPTYARPPRVVPTMAGTPSRTMTTPAVLYDDDMDAKYARRVEQELRDEEMARTLAAKEQEQVSQLQARNLATTTRAQRNDGCSCSRILGYVVPLLILGGLGAFLIYWFYGGQVPGFLPSLQDFANTDPFNATGPDQADRWPNNGQGLAITIVNALDSSWDSYFNTAVSEWDGGSPDALTLTISQASSPDPNCTPIDGVIKVCNNNYGDTQWRGLNKLAIQGGYIVSSIAMMNEYYLSTADDAQKQYTMCHEMGHGFGLPHSDENFYNKDLGECMDYTSHPANNDHPDTANFEFLATMYGTVPGSAPYNGTRFLEERVLSDRYLESWNELETVASGREVEFGWILLYHNEYGEAHLKDLGDGLAIQVEKLFVL